MTELEKEKLYHYKGTLYCYPSAERLRLRRRLLSRCIYFVIVSVSAMTQEYFSRSVLVYTIATITLIFAVFDAFMELYAPPGCLSELMGYSPKDLEDRGGLSIRFTPERNVSTQWI
jgi:hypothetical protein